VIFLEYHEGDAKRQGEPEERHLPDQRLNPAQREVGVLEDEEQTEVLGDAQRQARAGPNAATRDVLRQRIIDQGGNQHDEDEARFSPGVEHYACQQNGHVARSLRRHLVEQDRERKENKQEEGCGE
jgi:hypothetical protein